ncbi:MAG: polymerase PolC, partial [Paenibacillus sp.]|nr:polymerase PolC [Paenibacillus sp.]
MSFTADKRKRFELLLTQAAVPNNVVEAYFADGHIERVECSRSNREWTFFINKSTLIPLDIYRSLYKMIQDKFAHISKIRLVLNYAEEVSDLALVDAYWGLFLEWVQREATSVNGWMSKAQYEVAAGG